MTTAFEAHTEGAVSDDAAVNAQDRTARATWDEAAFRRTFGHEVATVNTGVRIHYVIGGEGPPLVLLHGFPQNWREWRHVMPPLAEAGHTVIAPDLRGFGDSDKPRLRPDGVSRRRHQQLRPDVRRFGWRPRRARLPPRATRECRRKPAAIAAPAHHARPGHRCRTELRHENRGSRAAIRRERDQPRRAAQRPLDPRRTPRLAGAKAHHVPRRESPVTRPSLLN